MQVLRQPSLLTSILGRASKQDAGDVGEELHRLIHACLASESSQYSGRELTDVVSWFKHRHGHSLTGDDKLASIMAMLHDLDRLVRIPCFASRPSMLADEVGFIKTAGDRRQSIDLLCQVAHQLNDLTSTAPALAFLLKQKTKTMVDDYFKSQQSARRANWIVSTVVEAVPDAKGACMWHVACACTCGMCMYMWHVACGMWHVHVHVT